MTPLEMIHARMVELHDELCDLRIAERVMRRLAEAKSQAASQTEEDPEPECLIDVSPAPTLAAAVEAEVREKVEDPLLAEVRAEAGKRGLAMAAASREIFGNPSQIYQIRASHEGYARRARAWLHGDEPSPPAANCDGQPKQALPSKPARTFEEQVERVARGEVGIAPAFHASRATPDLTLGGVTGEIL